MLQGFVGNSHNYVTRQKNNLRISQIKHEFAKKCFRYCIHVLYNTSPRSILDKLSSHSEDGFVLFNKNYMIKFYSITCTVLNCYICRQNNI